MISVTEVLDYFTEPELLAWKLRTPRAKMEKTSQDALIIGSSVDKLVQKDLGRDVGLVEYSDVYKEPVTNCMRAWEAFKEGHSEIIASIKEIQAELCSDGIMGHPDLICEDGIIDVKTSGAIYPKYWIQTGQYARMAGKTGFIGVLRLDKRSGIYQYVQFTDKSFIEYCGKVFDAYRTAYEHGEKVREELRQQLEREVL